MKVLLAYIDPATGSIVLQIAIAAVLGLGVTFRRVLAYPLRIFGFRSKKNTAVTKTTCEES